MLYHFLFPLSEDLKIFNLFKYITFRTGGAILTAFFVGVILGPWLIKKFRIWQKGGQPIRADGPASHFSKQGTPTMGGSLILVALTVSTLLWAKLTNPYVWMCLAVTLAFGALGFYDDYLKVKKRNAKGASARFRLLLQFAASALLFAAFMRVNGTETATTMFFPYLKSLTIDLGWFYAVFAMFVITGSANAVNLTDGLDGLCTTIVIIVTAVLLLTTYVVGNVVFSAYFFIPYVPNVGEVTIFAGAIIGACLAFLWYNAFPAQIFMGDMGSLALGGALGTISVLTKQEFTLAIAGVVFVVEALSVIMQVLSYRYRHGKRIFLMAPIHHHFEKKGWPETRVVFRFVIASCIMALLALATLKVR